MNKVVHSLLLSFLLFLYISSSAFAESLVQECPDIKIVIDGKTVSFQSPPIIAEGRTLLPLREILVNLGVQNDGQHIVWNGTESSVTVHKDATDLYLKVGSRTALINDSPVTLDVPPVVHQDRTYIPAGFVSQSLGRKVVWDDAGRTVLIREEAGYNHTKALLDQVYSAMNSLEKYILDQHVDLSIAKTSLSIYTKGKAQVLLDLKKRISVLRGEMTQEIPKISSNMSVKLDAYSINDTRYFKNPITGKWEKADDGWGQFGNIQDPYLFLKEGNKLHASMLLQESAGSNELVLEGSQYIHEWLGPVLAAAELEQYTVEEANTVIRVDKDTLLIKSIYMKARGTAVTGTGKNGWEMDMSFRNSSFNGDFPVEPPVERIQ